MRIAVIGGGITGLITALGLSRAGHPVTVLERDATPLPESPLEAFEHWERQGAPQARHSHAFLARLRNLLRDRFPDLLEALLEHGAEELPLSHSLREPIDDPTPQAGDEDLTLLACRRITFEWVLRRFAQAEPKLHFLDGAKVTGLLTSDDVVRGLRFKKNGRPQSLESDLVIDASGRRSKLSAWLQAEGFGKPDEEQEPCGIFYCSRFYRLLPGVQPPLRDTTIGGDLGYLKYAIFHGDSGIFSITFAAAPEDRPLRALLQASAFERAARLLPATAGWVDIRMAEAITPVHAMDGLRNTRRFYFREGSPIAQGVIAIGDAVIHSNPLYGRGCTLGLIHAVGLIDAIDQHGENVDAIARATEEIFEREIVPWYEFSVMQDREAAAVARILREDPTAMDEVSKNGRVDPRVYMRDLIRNGLLPALRLDAVVLRSFMRAFNLLDPPSNLLQKPDIMLRVLEVYQRRHDRQEAPLGPDRKTFLSQLENSMGTKPSPQPSLFETRC